MTKREKTKALFVELINEQLKPHGVTYKDVSGIPDWYMQYTTTPEKEEAFISHCVSRIREVLKLNKQMAIKEAQWFILQWGLTLGNSRNITKANSSQELKSKKTL